MKKTILAFTILCAFTLNGIAQQQTHLVNFHPLGLINKAKLKYEFALNDQFTVGSFGSFYYGLFPGVQVAPIARIYFGEEAPHGLYLQAKAIGAFHNRIYNFNTFEDHTQSFSSFGGGLGLGFQILSGRDNNIVIDIGIGGRYMTAVPDPDITWGGSVDNAVWYTTGPGSLFDGTLAVGFAF